MEIGNSEILRELHLHVGFVVQASQYMEMMISGSLTTLSNKSDQVLSNDIFNEKYEAFSKNTLGRLCGLLKEKLDFTEDQLSIIKVAVADRNYIIHSILTDQNYDFLTEQGCSLALDRVQLAMGNINPSVDILDAIVKKTFKGERDKVNS